MYAISIGRNEGEPHLMSLEKHGTREPSFYAPNEGRRELSVANRLENERLQQLTTVQRSGGVCEDGMLRSVPRRSWEILQRLQEVGVLHSSDEVFVMKMERRRGTYVNAIHRRKGSGDGE